MDSSDNRYGFDNFQLRLELQVRAQGPRNQTQLLGAFEQVQRAIPFLGAGDLEIGAYYDLCETVTGVDLAHGSAGFDLQVSKVELSGARNRPQGRGITTGNGGEQ